MAGNNADSRRVMIPLYMDQNAFRQVIRAEMAEMSTTETRINEKIEDKFRDVEAKINERFTELEVKLMEKLQEILTKEKSNLVPGAIITSPVPNVVPHRPA